MSTCLLLAAFSAMCWVGIFLSNRAANADRAAHHAWWVNYNKAADKRHREFMYAMGHDDGPAPSPPN